MRRGQVGGRGLGGGVADTIIRICVGMESLRGSVLKKGRRQRSGIDTIKYLIHQASIANEIDWMH